MYRSLDTAKTINTIDKLRHRIEERFPNSGLASVCGELHTVANECKSRAEWISKPHIPLRVGVMIIIAIILAALVFSIVALLDLSSTRFQVTELVQLIESGINDLILIGAAVIFLFTAERRIKRSRALSSMHELRAIAHVIDMHQLTKDPSRLMKGGIITPSSPNPNLTAFQLTRYLDYCSEMLSLTGKVAALYAQTTEDAVVLSAVTEIEELTTGLSRKIWQKIMILHKLDEEGMLTNESPLG